MLRTLLTICLLLGLGAAGHSLTAQTTAANRPPDAGQRVDSTLKPVLEQVKDVEDPTLRVFLRLQVANYLWAAPSRGSLKAEEIASLALADLQANEERMPSFYVKMFRRDLLAKLHLHAPSVAAKLTSEYGLERDKGPGEMELAYSMLGSDHAVERAVSLVRHTVAKGGDPNKLIVFFLHRLEERSAAEAVALLSEVLRIEEQQPHTIPVGTFFVLSHLYLRDSVPADLQRRFVVAAVNAARVDPSVSDPFVLTEAYGLLKGLMPSVVKLQPGLVALANAQAAALAPRVPRSVVERIEIDQRVRQSADPLNQMLVEADATRDASMKESLLRDAAQLSVERGQLRQAIDLVTQMRLTGEDALLWRDQFIEDAAARALDAKNPDLAGYAAGHIGSPLMRASVLQKMSLYFYAAKDVQSARETLNSALKLIRSTDDDVSKAVALMSITPAFLKVDEQRAFEPTQAAVDLINNTLHAAPGSAPRGARAQASAENFMKVAHSSIPVFRLLCSKDSDGATSLANSIRVREIKTSALFGVSTGILIQHNKRMAAQSR